MPKLPDFAGADGRRIRLSSVGVPATLLLLALLAIAGYLPFNRYREGQEIRQYVGGPFGAQLLYLQGCAAEDDGDGGRPGALEEQLESCQRAKGGRRAGYYVYDFNIRRAVALTVRDLALWKKYSVLSFPDSVYGEVRNSETNPFNRIVPFAEFVGFDYDCAPTESNGGFSCKRASASCAQSAETIRCTVFNPRADRTELHVIVRYAELDLLLPQGFITGPDLFKLLKPRFFPVLDRF